jgi:hypothetical protein
MTPFSGPIQRSCESLTRWRHVWPQSATRESRVRPLTRSARWAMAEQTISLPRPIVKVWGIVSVAGKEGVWRKELGVYVGGWAV